MNKALLLIDIQKEYFENGALELVNPIAASENAKKLLELFRKENGTIIHVQHISGEGAPIFVPVTKGVDIHENVKPLAGEKVITKQFPNSFRGTDLLEYLQLKEITHLVIAGMMTHMCIDAGTRAAVDFGFECTVIGDACATLNLQINGQEVKAADVHNAFLAALEFFYAKITTTEDYLQS
ncbi:cysteine hydrolase family protein [Flavobacterium sp. PL02]|uniref:cysteine hydrolase family protein n=1 Tax=Flavobacterium sp. PL02 TaxID=3088354 RepID=UPI002B23C89B|nr:cysteine hydrolase family protein [Flavobacterium sp. PL02]MEA9412828.1 cysteine hydrolase family protein [Flavobacterium sp. PL02]